MQLQGQLASYCFEDGWQQEKWSAKAVVRRAHLFMTSSCGGEPVMSTAIYWRVPTHTSSTRRVPDE